MRTTSSGRSATSYSVSATGGRWCFHVCAIALGAALMNACSRAPEPPPSRPLDSAASLILSEPVDHLDGLAREPMLVEHPDGTLFLTGYGEPVPRLWRSNDSGATWSRVDVGSESDGAVGNSDVDLAVAADGTLYFAAMTYDRAKNEGTQIAIGTSRDVGATWSWTRLSDARYADRPWVEVAPDGTSHVIWNDGSGVAYAVSRDRGASWQPQPRIHPQGCSSHLAIASNGQIAVRITPLSASGNVHHEGVDLVAVSSDGGATWAKHAAPGQRAW